jgi:hypothetical protein
MWENFGKKTFGKPRGRFDINFKINLRRRNCKDGTMMEGISRQSWTKCPQPKRTANSSGARVIERAVTVLLPKYKERLHAVSKFRAMSNEY